MKFGTQHQAQVDGHTSGHKQPTCVATIGCEETDMDQIDPNLSQHESTRPLYAMRMWASAHIYKVI